MAFKLGFYLLGVSDLISSCDAVECCGFLLVWGRYDNMMLVTGEWSVKLKRNYLNACNYLFCNTKESIYKLITFRTKSPKRK